MSNPGTPPIEAVDRALQLVNLLREEGAVSVKDAAERLDVAPSTAHRLLAALVYRDFAVQDEERQYLPGPAMVVREWEALPVDALRVALRPALELVFEQARETAQLLVRQRGNVRFVEGIQLDAPLRVTVRSGDLMPAFTSAGGKALLAELRDEQLDSLYPKGLPDWPTARLKDLAALKRQLAKVRKAGYGTNLEETEQGVCGIGVAVHDSIGRGVAAFTVAVPSVRFERADIPHYLEALRAGGALATELLPVSGVAG
jgi:DNA-binding IclR family transcriptional regulator